MNLFWNVLLGVLTGFGVGLIFILFHHLYTRRSRYPKFLYHPYETRSKLETLLHYKRLRDAAEERVYGSSVKPLRARTLLGLLNEDEEPKFSFDESETNKWVKKYETKLKEEQKERQQMLKHMESMRQKKIDKKKQKEEAELKKKEYEEGRSSRLAKAALMLDEQEGQSKRRKKINE